MRTLKEEVTKFLRELAPRGWGVWYVEAKNDTPYPYILYHVPAGDPDAAMGSFGTDDREYTISIQCISQDAEEAINVSSAIDDALSGHIFDLGAGWQQIGRVAWTGIVPDPGDRLPNLSLVYYDGNTYTVRVTRARVYV